MVHTAIGFAKASHRLATLACTASIGPGSTNMITGAAAATINRLPVLLFPSDYYATRHQGPVLQQLEHPISADVSVNDCFRPVSRFFDRIIRPEQILTALPEAMRVLTDPAETGAVTIALPQDIQAHAYDYPQHFFRERRWRVERRPCDPERIREAVALLAAAQRPVIIAGGGVHYSEAWSELQEFADALGIPVGETFAGKGRAQGSLADRAGRHRSRGNGNRGRVDRRGRSGDLRRHPADRFRHRLAVVLPPSRSAVHQYQRVRARRIQARRTADRGRRATGARGLAQAARWPPASASRQPTRPRSPRPEAPGPRRCGPRSSRDREGEAMSQGQLIGLLNREARAGDTVIAASGGPPGDLLKLWDAAGGRQLSSRIRLLVHGLRDPRRAWASAWLSPRVRSSS